MEVNTQLTRQPRCISIAFSADNEVRYKGSSGGFVTELAKYLFETKKISSALCYKFQGRDLFVPYIARNYKEYNQTGSIYHQIDLFSFIKGNLDSIQSPLFVTCLPCQVQGVRTILKKKNIECFVVALVCSGQLTKEATYDFLKRNKIRIEDIKLLRYRGNGWPSGVTIDMKDGNTYFYDNLTSDWFYFFHSTIYNTNKCFYCLNTFGADADMAVADPWLSRYKNHEKTGCSVVVVYSKEALDVFEQMLNEKVLLLQENINIEELERSQKGTLLKKELYVKHNKLIHFLVRVYRTWWYRKMFLWFPRLHHKIHNYLFSMLTRIMS